MRTLITAVSALALAAVAAPAFAQDAAASDFTVTGSATGTSDYRFRGLSQSNKRFAIQGSLTVTHSSGFYVSAWSSSIDDYVAAGADAELDLIAGYSRTFDGFTIDGGLLYYVYPNAVKGVNTDFFEPYLSAKYTFGPVTGKVGAAYAWKQHAIAAFHERDDNLYVYGELSGAVPDTPFAITGHLGNSHGRSFLTGGFKNYLDWNVGATYTLKNITFGLSYVDTDADKGDFSSFSSGGNRNIAKAGIVGSIGVAF